jgi:hypothetical protein
MLCIFATVKGRKIPAKTPLPVLGQGFPAFKKLFPDVQFEFPVIHWKELCADPRK